MANNLPNLQVGQYVKQPWLTPVRLVASTNVTATYFNGFSNNGVGATMTFATGTLTVDSVLVALYDRILLATQTNGWEAGIYICVQAGATGVSAILQRAADWQDIEQIFPGQYVSVAAGTTFAGSIWTFVEPMPQKFGVSSATAENDIVWLQV
jgi:hypothetical protein